MIGRLRRSAPRMSPGLAAPADSGDFAESGSVRRPEPTDANGYAAAGVLVAPRSAIEVHKMRLNHSIDRPAESSARTAPSKARRPEISVSFFCRVSLELSVEYTFLRS